jgi:hypothetical protein
VIIQIDTKQNRPQSRARWSFAALYYCVKRTLVILDNYLISDKYGCSRRIYCLSSY